MTDRDVIEAVARVDCWLRDALRLLPAVVLLTALLLVIVFSVRGFVDCLRSPPVDYDAPGVDITSEGPDGDWTEAWYKTKDGDEGHE